MHLTHTSGTRKSVFVPHDASNGKSRGGGLVTSPLIFHSARINWWWVGHKDGR